MLPVISGGYSAIPASSHMRFQTMRGAEVLSLRYTFLSVPVPVPVAGADCHLPVVPVVPVVPVGGCRLVVAGWWLPVPVAGCRLPSPPKVAKPIRLYAYTCIRYTHILLMES